jgi:hypothetical protein
MRFILFIGLCLLVTSCATMFNSSNTTVNVHSKAGSQTTVDCVKKTIKKKGGAPFVVNRSPDSLLITVINDSIAKEVRVASRPSRTGYLNILNLGLGFKKDRRSVEQYTYPKNIWVPLDGPDNHYYTENPKLKGMLGVHFSVPLLNAVYYRISPTEDHSEVLPFGFTLGVNYWIKSSVYLSFEVGGSTNFDIMEHFGDTLTKYPHWIAFLTARKNHVVGGFTLGYGLELSHYHWETHDMVKQKPEYLILNRKTYNTTGMGPVLAAYLNMGPVITVGMKYHTQLLSYSDQLRLRYGHIISFEAQFNFPTKRKYIFN